MRSAAGDRVKTANRSRHIALLLGAMLIDALGACRGPAHSAEGDQDSGPGYLEGKATIGPICPVEREGEPCEVPPAAYAARKIVIYAPDRQRVVATIGLDSTGHYRGELAAGRYVVDINRIGIDFSKDLPREVTIRAGETVRLDVSIDTGIR